MATNIGASKRGCFTLSVAIMVILLCSTGLTRTWAALLDTNRNISWNDVSIKEEEIHQKLVLNNPRYIFYITLQPQPFCNEKLYGNCLKAFATVKSRCTYYVRCRS
ncbi:hypothetical protein MANES_02G057600v8 [Manihot esculenta]|uniref:Uncharacterized protein n=1 Tax=Manihot esculenta TaxID=3983 RepID=A0A2C9WB68_MANES|nr:hypothetical protein MANES_02G057600v8 [Manihot esculenta]